DLSRLSHSSRQSWLRSGYGRLHRMKELLESAAVLVSLLAIVVGAVVVVWQVRENSRAELRLKIYDGLAELVQKATYDLIALHTTILGLPRALKMDRDSPARGLEDWSPSCPSGIDLNEQHASVSTALLNVTFWMERWEVAVP